MSWDYCGQYSRILWYKYHRRIGESPDGVGHSDLHTSVSVHVTLNTLLCCPVIQGVLNYIFFKRPKHQSSENLVWPAIMKDSEMFLCSPVSTRDSRYPWYFYFHPHSCLHRDEHHTRKAHELRGSASELHLSHVHCLINWVIDLAWYSFASKSKVKTLPWG